MVHPLLITFHFSLITHTLLRDYVQKQLNPQTWIERMTPWQLGLLVLLLFGVSALAFFLERSGTRRVPFAPQPSEQFFLINDFENVTMQQVPLVLGDTAVFPGRLDDVETAGLLGLNVRTGTLRWSVSNDEQSRPDWWMDEMAWTFPLDWEWGPLATDGERVFTADRLLLTTTVYAFSLADGARLWERELGVINGSPVRSLRLIDGQLVARIVEPGYAELTILDPVNGRVLFHRSNENAANLYWIEQNESLSREYRQYNSGLDATQGLSAAPWQHRFNNCGITPQVSETRIVVHARMCDDSGQPDPSQRAALFALDRQTGQQLWVLESVPVISNIAIDGDVGYAVSVDSQLFALDLNSGGVIGIVNFGQPDHELRPDERIFVGSSGGVTAVYFSANRHLYVFENILLTD